MDNPGIKTKKPNRECPVMPGGMCSASFGALWSQPFIMMKTAHFPSRVADSSAIVCRRRLCPPLTSGSLFSGKVISRSGRLLQCLSVNRRCATFNLQYDFPENGLIRGHDHIPGRKRLFSVNKLRNIANKVSITYILIVSFVFLITIPVVATSTAAYFKSKEIIYTNTTQYIVQTLKQTNGEIDLKLDRFNSDAAFLIDPTVQKLLNKQVDQELSFQEKKTLSNIAVDFNITSPEMMAISVYSIKGKFLAGLTSDVPKTADLTEEIMDICRQLNGRVHWRYAGKDRFQQSSIQGIRLIKNMQGPNMNPIGFLSFEVPERLIYQSIEELSLGKTGQVLIVDAGGTILSGQERQWIGTLLDKENRERIFSQREGSYIGSFNGDSYFIAFHTSDTTGWKTLGLVPIDEMTPGLMEVYKSNILYLVFWIILSIVLSLIITRSVVSPIKKLILAMRGVEEGDFDVQTNFYGNKEVMILSGKFNKMTSRLKELINRVYEEELKEKNAQLRALQAQINPHFLYNTLDTIYWMLYMRGEEKIGDLIVAMSSMLRYSIRKSGPLVTLKDELDNLFNYIHIQSTRYEDRLSFDFEIDESLYPARIPKLSLQPIVENAITHGLEPKETPGRIQIVAYREGEELRIKISDNGVGMTKEQLEQFRRKSQIGQGYGIQNVDERIRLLFGEDYGLEIDSIEGQGVTVLYKIPLQYER